MKRIGLRAIFLVASVVAYAQESISFEKSNFSSILEKAQKENKIIFMDAYASWCGPCKLMDKNVFTDKNVKAYYDATFINAKIDMEKGEGREIASKYGVYSYPTYLFLKGNGELVYRGVGYLQPNEFIALGKEAQASLAGGSAKERFSKGERDPRFLLSAARMNATTDPEFAKKAAQTYFELKKDLVYTQEEIAMMLHFMKSVQDPIYIFFQRDKSEITKVLPENYYTQIYNQLNIDFHVSQSIDYDKKAINETYFLERITPLIGDQEAQNILKKIQLTFYPSVHNFVDYEQVALDVYGEGDGYSSQELTLAASIFLDHITKAESLDKAVIWAEKAVMQTETPENTLVLAGLYNATNKKSQAKMYAERSMSLHQQNGKDVTPVKKLLSSIK